VVQAFFKQPEERDNPVVFSQEKQTKFQNDENWRDKF
jgi:hypothetical protein